MPSADRDFADVVAAAAFTRPADTTAYASGDLVANSTTAGSVVPLSFLLVNAGSGGQSQIERARLLTSSTSVTNASFRLHLFETSPTSAVGDNAAFSCTNASYCGAMDIVVAQAFSDGAAGVGVPNIGTRIVVEPTATTLYGLLEARAAYTPTSGGTFTVTLELYHV